MVPIAPLKGTFMIISILGFILSVLYLYDFKDAQGNIYPWAPTWGLTFAIIFAIMFIASVFSMTYAPIEAELQIDEKRKSKKR